MSNSITISIQHVSKKYNLGKKKEGTLREALTGLLRRKADKPTFYALDDVSFSIEQGEVIGIIGRNGAGKSTLLKVLSQITTPTAGRIEIEGRVASLLEVGTGFHPELTGRENIYLNGTILGMSRKEVKAKIDQIIEFAGVEKFIDTAVKHYSSGMYVRLAFSVAAHLEPEILIIDEVLAVGDAEFQKKCLGKMKDVSTQGRTVLFVSHDMGAVANLCNRVVVLSEGKVIFDGETSEGINRYLTAKKELAHTSLEERKDRSGTGMIRFKEVHFEDANGVPLSNVCSGMHMRFKLNFSASDELKNVIFRIQIVDHRGAILTTLNNFHSSEPFKSLSNDFVYCEIKQLPLFDGEYTLNLQAIVNNEIADEIEHGALLTVEKGNFYVTGKLPDIKQGILVDHEWKIS